MELYIGVILGVILGVVVNQCASKCVVVVAVSCPVVSYLLLAATGTANVDMWIAWVEKSFLGLDLYLVGRLPYTYSRKVFRFF